MEQNEGEEYPQEKQEGVVVIDHEGEQENQENEGEAPRDDLEEQALIEKERSPRRVEIFRKQIHEDLPLFRSLTSDPDWDFIIEPKEEVDEDIEKPQVEMKEDYYPDLPQYEYQMFSKIVLFFFALVFFSLTLTLISVLCFEWGESTVFWSTLGGLFFTWGFLCVLRQDKKRKGKKRQTYIDEQDQVKAADQAIYDEEMEKYEAKLKKRHQYVMVINQIKRFSKKLFHDKQPRHALKLFQNSVLNPYLKISQSIPDFCRKFIDDEIKDVRQFNDLDDQYKPWYIKDIFSTHLYLTWMLNYAFETQDLREEEKADFRELKNHLIVVLQDQDICQYIAEMVEDEDDPYTAKKVKEIFSDLDMSDREEKEKEQMLYQRIQDAQTLYKKVMRELQGLHDEEPKVKEFEGEMDFDSPDGKQSYVKKGFKRGFSPTRALMKRLTLKPGDKQKEYQVSEANSQNFDEEEVKE